MPYYFSSNFSHIKSLDYQRIREGRPVGVIHPSWPYQRLVYESFLIAVTGRSEVSRDLVSRDTLELYQK